MAIIIRKTKQSDAEQYITLLDYVWKITYSHIFPEEVFVGREKTAPDRIATFDENKRNNEQTICCVAENDGVIVGLMLGTINSDYDYFKEKNYADLCVLYVHPNYHKQGIATKLKAEFIKFAKEKGYNKFVIGILKENYNARKVYERWGGKLDDYSQGFKMLDNEYDEVFYTFKI